jgi:hypothetical protein
MSENKQSVGEGNKVIKFSEKGTFQSLYAAQKWAKENGYSYGSLDGHNPVALISGEYNLPEKWHNINYKGKHIVDGIMLSKNWREGVVEIILYNQNKQS